MFLAYLIICAIVVLIMIGIEWVMRRMEISDGSVFSREEIRWRRKVAILIGIVLFLGLWFYVAVIPHDPVSFLGL